MVPRIIIIIVHYHNDYDYHNDNHYDNDYHYHNDTQYGCGS